MDNILRVGTNHRSYKNIYSELEPITGDTRAYAQSWNQSQEIQVHMLGVGTNHRRYKCVYCEMEPDGRYNPGRFTLIGVGVKGRFRCCHVIGGLGCGAHRRLRPPPRGATGGARKD
eukprot:950449-Pyramimonas_sp.AAC.1